MWFGVQSTTTQRKEETPEESVCVLCVYFVQQQGLLMCNPCKLSNGWNMKTEIRPPTTTTLFRQRTTLPPPSRRLSLNSLSCATLLWPRTTPIADPIASLYRCGDIDGRFAHLGADRARIIVVPNVLVNLSEPRTANLNRCGRLNRWISKFSTFSVYYFVIHFAIIISALPLQPLSNNLANQCGLGIRFAKKYRVGEWIIETEKLRENRRRRRRNCNLQTKCNVAIKLERQRRKISQINCIPTIQMCKTNQRIVEEGSTCSWLPFGPEESPSPLLR